MVGKVRESNFGSFTAKSERDVSVPFLWIFNVSILMIDLLQVVAAAVPLVDSNTKVDLGLH